uniref:Transketolase n=1 Tax=Hydra vulgaris TaxID=6087 RepID=T2MGT2_HYDVU
MKKGKKKNIFSKIIMALNHSPDKQKLQDLANRLRILSIKCTNASKSGHPTSCCSMAELTSVLFFHTLKYKVSSPKDPSSDRFVLSKGHCAPILYSAWCLAGLFPESELMKLRQIDNDLEGHPTPRLSFVDVATGSLGQGLSCAAGMAYTGKYFDKASYRVFCLMGDGESAEGSVIEAANFSSFYKLDNLVAIIDVNRLGQSDPTSIQHDLNYYQRMWEGHGWNSIIVDGHDIEAICQAFYDAEHFKGKPTILLAKTYKGKGIPGVEDQMNWHGKPIGDKTVEAISAIESQMIDKNISGENINHQIVIDDAKEIDIQPIYLSELPTYKPTDKIATREAYGLALAKLGRSSERVVAMDGDTKNSTFAITFQKEFPERFIECFIAEQNLVGVGIGCASRDRTVAFASTFAAFFSRAYDQIRMGGISQTKLKMVGSHVGVSIGEDGPSQMALEDLAMFRAIPNCVVFYPSDGVSCERAVELAANIPTMCYIRTSRPATVNVYPNDTSFTVGRGKVVHQSDKDVCLLVGAGVTLHECLKAYNVLKSEGLYVRVFDPFTIKPLDHEGLISNAIACEGKVVVVEDHYPEGGLGEAVSGALSMTNVRVKRISVNGLPRSGPPDALLELFGISSNHIIAAVKNAF